MTKRIPAFAKKRGFTVKIFKRHWTRAKKVCSVNNADGSTVKINGTKAQGGYGSRCVIADAVVEFLGPDTPIKTGYDGKGVYLDLGVSSSMASIGGKSFSHDGINLVNAFDSGDSPEARGLKFPVLVAFKPV